MLNESSGFMGVNLPSYRSLLYGLLVLAMVLAPLSFSRDADASDHHSKSSMSHTGGSGGDGHADHDHALFHCGSLSCSPSNLNSSSSSCLSETSVSRMKALVADDPFLRSLYLDCDPPVPRSGFSKA